MTEVPPVLEYDRPPEPPPARTGEFVVQFIAAAVMVGVLTGVLVFARRIGVVFADFNLRLPAATRVLLKASSLFHNLYGWLAIWVIPFVVPFLLARLDGATRRRVLRITILVLGAFIVFVIVALFVPLIRLTESVR